MVETPEEIGRNEFDEWCWRRGLDLRAIADGLALEAAKLKAETGRDIRPPSIETVRLIRLPFTDARRRVPGPEVLELIQRFTAGAIIAAHFYPHHMRGAPVSHSEAAQP